MNHEPARQPAELGQLASLRPAPWPAPGPPGQPPGQPPWPGPGTPLAGSQAGPAWPAGLLAGSELFDFSMKNSYEAGHEAAHEAAATVLHRFMDRARTVARPRGLRCDTPPVATWSSALL